MKEKMLVSSFTLVGSLVSYYYAKAYTKDIAPYVMVGGFIGALVGELIVKTNSKD
jgi:uncharacterized membrane protein YfcA